MKITTVNELRKAISSARGYSSAWGRGVKEYARELCDEIEGWQDWENRNDLPESWELQKILLSGADTWKDYSAGGFSLIYNSDIAERLCTLSELKKTDYGRKEPNARESWLDVQARALWQAYILIKNILG